MEGLNWPLMDDGSVSSLGGNIFASQALINCGHTVRGILTSRGRFAEMKFA